MKKKIFVRGPVLSQSGYGEQSRFALRALRSREDLFDIYVQPINWGQTGWVWEDNEFRRWIDSRILETQLLMQNKQLQPDMSLQITIPNEFQKLCPINIGYTAGIETTKVAPQWLQKGNDMDKILVVSQHAKDSYVNTVAQAQNQQTGETFPYKLETPVEVVWENTPMSETTEAIEGFEPRHDFNFLVVSQMGPRKNLENTIKWFVEEFIDQDVGLILKTNLKSNSRMDKEFAEASIKAILASYPDRKCSVSLLHGDLAESQMRGLYEHDKVKAMVNISHGEGFGLPLFEAARSALPIISVGWSGQMDFLRHNGKDLFLKVKHELKPVQKQAVWDGVIQADSQWAYADQGSFKMALRQMYKKHSEFETQARKLKGLVNEKFSDQVLFENFCSHIGAKKLEKSDFVFVSDFFKDQYVGGAELSLDVLIDSCKDSKTCINSNLVSKKLVDVNKDSTWIFGNIANINTDILNYIVENDIRYYFVEFDYKFCEYRNPKLYHFLEDEECNYRDTEKGILYEKFINNSQKTFFMSDKQKEIFKSNLKLNTNKLKTLSSIFDKKFFEKIKELRGREKSEKWIVLGSNSWVKGAQESEDWCSKNNLEYEVLWGLSYDEFLEKLSTAKGICFKPSGYDTCPRFVIEAKILGCELELNENVQHLGEEWFELDPDGILSYLEKRSDVFWETLGEK